MKKNKSDNDDVPFRIERLLAAGHSLEDIASKTGISLSTVYRWRAGKMKPHRSFLRLFAEAERTLSGK